MKVLINVDVNDLARAERFYTAAFGLKVSRRLGSAGVELSGSSAAIYLLAKEPGTAPSDNTTQRRTYERHWTPLHLDFVTEDIEQAVQQARAAGATLETPVAAQKWGKLALMSDPFGHGFCFVQFIGRGYDEIAEPAV